MDWLDLFARLDPEARATASAALATDDRVYQTSVAGRVSATLRMREVTVRRAAPAERARYIELCAKRSAPVAHLAVMALHTDVRRGLLLDFLASVGVAHDERGFVALGEPPPPVATLRAAIATVRTRHPADYVEMLLDTLQCFDVPVWLHLSDARAATPAHAPEPLWDEPPSTVSPAPTPVVPPDAPPTAVEESHDPAPDAEGDAAFTPLDEMLRRAVLEAAAERNEEVRFDFVRDLVDEVLALRQDRRRSYIHLGFLDATEGRPIDPMFPGTGPRRRAWYLCGAIEALERAGARDRIAHLFDRWREELAALLRGDHDAGPRVAPLVYGALVAGRRRAEAVAALGAGCVRRCDIGFQQRLLEDTAVLLREDRTEEAAPILDLVDQGLQGAEARGEDVRALRAEASRRRAHVLRHRGDWDGARARLESVVRDGAGRHASRVFADLGLVACGMRRLSEVALSDDESQLPSLAERLERGRLHFEASANQPQALGGHGDYVLGVLAIAKGRTPEAARHLDRAVAAMAAEPDVYRPSGLLAQAEAGLSLALAERTDASTAPRVADLLRSAMATPGVRLPIWLVQRTLFGLATADTGAAARLLEQLGAEWMDAGLDILKGQGVLSRSPALRERLLARAANTARRRSERWDDAIGLLDEARAGRDGQCLDHGQRALEALESLADDRPSTERLLSLLEQREFYDPFWDIEAVEWTRIRLLDQVGRTTDAAQVRIDLCHRLLTHEPDRARDEVPDLFQEIRDGGVEYPAALVARLRTLDADEPPPPPPRPTQRVRVLFIGGNEKQERHAEEVRTRVRKRHPGAEVTFEHTGWSSNWGRDLDRIARRIREHDVVVVMRFVRTLLGEAVRRTCNDAGRRWVPCTGHGRDSMVRAIEAAIRIVPSGTATVG